MKLGEEGKKKDCSQGNGHWPGGHTREGNEEMPESSSGWVPDYTVVLQSKVAIT